MKLLLTLLLTAVAWACSAHDLVLIPETMAGGPALRIKFGHPAEWETPEVHRLFKLDGCAPGGQTVSFLARLEPQAGDLLVTNLLAATDAPGTWIIAGIYDNGFWAHVNDQVYFNTTKTEYPGAASSGHYMKFAKTLINHGSASPDFAREIGYRLEIIPQSDPAMVRRGQSLAVKVLYQGKPLVNVGVEIGDGKTKMKEEDIPRYKTDATGVALVPVNHEGLQIVAVDYVTPSRTPNVCDQDNYSSTLTFFSANTGPAKP